MSDRGLLMRAKAKDLGNQLSKPVMMQAASKWSNISLCLIALFDLAGAAQRKCV